MKITDRFIGDHKTFRKMMGDIRAIAETPAAERDQRKLVRLTELLRHHLVIHSWFEDEFYYPAMRETFLNNRMPPLTDAYMCTLEEEHKAIDGSLDRLEREVRADPAGAWPQAFAAFFHGLSSHMRKEEEELFPASVKLLGDAGLERLSLEMERHRSDAPKVRLPSNI